ncbi:MAG: T9SS type A sorting domain-containing protein [Bacteroidales bacterium]|nr:T9SS type A sorting domain-containing protein [Bacteroidales bacterium]
MRKYFTLTLVFSALFIGVSAQQHELAKESMEKHAQTSKLLNAETKTNPTNIEAQKGSTATIQELLARRDKIGKQLGAVSAHFSMEEQQMLRSYFSTQQATRTATNSNALTTIYGIDNPSKELIGFGPTSPENTEVFGNSPITVNFEDAGAIDPNNPTTGYVIDDWGEFYSFDVETGFYTYLGSMYGWWLDMEYDRTTGNLYAISEGKLYIIDPIAVTATEVGTLGIPAEYFPATLAIDGNGVGYTFEMINFGFYSIDLETAATTYIGQIGYTANYSQGMAYDPTTDMVYISAFSDDTFSAELRSVDLETGMSTFIGTIVTPAEFTQVAWISFGETLAPATCPRPTNLAVSNITSSSVDFSWDAEPDASNGYIWSIFKLGDHPLSDTPVATGTTPAGTTTVNITDLLDGLPYDCYVAADCESNGMSQLAGPVKFSTLPTCGGKFFDSGGPHQNYSDNENKTTVISPEIYGDPVTVTFTLFDVEDEFDALYVYDGPDANSPMISSGNPETYSGFPAGGYYGIENPGPFTSTHPSGALTFVFLSGDLGVYPGWEADVSCTPVGIKDENLIEGFSFYPNPTDGIVDLKSIDNIEQISLFNVLGQIVITKQVDATSSQLDISSLNTGTYFMQVTANGRLGTYRVVKQ